MDLRQPGRGLMGKASHRKEHLSSSEREEVEEKRFPPTAATADPLHEVFGPGSS